MDFCNYEDYQIGGHLSFAKHMLSSFGSQLSLIGITTSASDPIGKWTRKKINGTEYDYFALARYNKLKTKHFIPDRIACYLLVIYFKKKILEIPARNVFVQRPEIIIALRTFGYKNICYRFPGTENALNTSKYWAGKYFASFFDKLFFSGLKNVNLILASADEEAITNMIERSNGLITRQDVVKFPTRINTETYKPSIKSDAREILEIPSDKILIITVGRLSWLKGWKLLLDSFLIFEKEHSGSCFYFLGDGEDLGKIKEYIELNNLKQKAFILGMKSPEEISLFLNASDLFVMGSHKEGWSTSLMEAVACGIPVCVTNFSSASEIVDEGVNGYIEKDWDFKSFAGLMSKALTLKIKEIELEKYSISGLKADILKLWDIKDM